LAEADHPRPKGRGNLLRRSSRFGYEGRVLAKESEGSKASAQPSIVWDDSDIRIIYANVADVRGTREEIGLLFRMNQAWHAGQKEVRVQLKE